jgi:hypothetical protein
MHVREAEGAADRCDDGADLQLLEFAEVIGRARSLCEFLKGGDLCPEHRHHGDVARRIDLVNRPKDRRGNK